MISLWSSSKVKKSQINVSLSDTKDSAKYWVKAIKFKITPLLNQHLQSSFLGFLLLEWTLRERIRFRLEVMMFTITGGMVDFS